MIDGLADSGSFHAQLQLGGQTGCSALLNFKQSRAAIETILQDRWRHQLFFHRAQILGFGSGSGLWWLWLIEQQSLIARVGVWWL